MSFDFNWVVILALIILGFIVSTMIDTQREKENNTYL